MPVAFHSSGGPPDGHSLAIPVSVEMPSRLGPRNWPQSGTPIAASFLDACPKEREVAVATVTRNSTRPKFFASFTVEASNCGTSSQSLYIYTRQRRAHLALPRDKRATGGQDIRNPGRMTFVTM